MNIFKSFSLILILFCLSCSNPLPTLEGIDTDQWAKDKNACGDARHSMRAAIEREKEKLLSLDQIEVVKLLGTPDQHELSSRNEKFFYYFLEPAPACNTTTGTRAVRLVIRFNAVGLAKEVFIESGR